jgi:hypothetical protein
MNNQTQATAQAPLVVKRDPLVAVTCAFVILAVFGYAYETVRQNVAVAAAAAASVGTKGPVAGKLDESSYTNAEAAHVTVTNLNAFPVESCFRAVVTGKGTGPVRAESVTVCTGEMKPRTTTVLVAPYRIGAVERLCSGPFDRFGNAHLDWSLCTFTTETVN